MSQDRAELTRDTYSIETFLHEAMLQSRHRTYDPEEADLFYVPGYIACYIYPVFGAADWPHWPGLNGTAAGQIGTRTGADNQGLCFSDISAPVFKGTRVLHRPLRRIRTQVHCEPSLQARRRGW